MSPLRNRALMAELKVSLNALRRLRGKRLAHVERGTKLSRSTVYRCFFGERPVSWESVWAVVRFLGGDLDEFGKLYDKAYGVQDAPVRGKPELQSGLSGEFSQLNTGGA